MIVLSQYAPLIQAALAAGVRGYLVKDDALTSGSLLAAIRCVGAGGAYLSDAVRRLLQAPQPLLSQRQVAILTLLATEPDLTQEALATRLGVSRHTITYHLRQIYRALGVNSIAAALVAALHLGLLPLPIPEPPAVDQEQES